MKLSALSRTTALAFCMFLLAAAVARAQDPAIIDSLLVDFWPEYDKPAMLVIYRGTLASRVRLPAPVSIRIPDRVGDPAAVAYRNDQGLFTLDYQMNGEGDESVVSFTTSTRDFQVEYYDPGLDLSTSTREYGTSTRLDHPVRRLILQVQQPPGAGNFTMTPSPAETRAGRTGLEYALVERRDVAAGDTITVQVSYYKPGNTLTVERPTASSAGPVLPLEEQDESIGGKRLIIVVIGGAVIVLALAAVGAFLFAAKRSRPAKGAAAQASRGRGERGSTEQRFCTRCGAPVEKGDRFCSQCGEKLKGA